MIPMASIIKKELKAYFTVGTGYVFLGFLVMITGFFFGIYNIDYQSALYAYTLNISTVAFFILIPTLTMRLFSEEARQRTDQLLYTSPLNIWQIVLGKYLAAFLLFLIGMAITGFFPLMLSFYGSVPFAETAGAFIGFILLGGCYIAIGLFISVLTDSQITAAVATFAVILLFFIMTAVKSGAPADPFSSLLFVLALIAAGAAFLYNSTKSILFGIISGAAGVIAAVTVYILKPVAYDGTIARFLSWFSVLDRFSGFTAGILILSDVVYYVLFSTAFIYLTINAIERRRWR